MDIFWSPMGGSIDMSCLDTHPPSINRIISNTLWLEPQPLIKHIVEERTKNISYLKCPAFNNLYKNTYVIKSPFDVKFMVSNTPEGKLITAIYKDEDFEKAFLSDRNAENSTFSMMSYGISYLFYSKQSVEMEICQPHMSAHISPTIRNMSVVCGKFDISKWIRPTDFAFEIIDDTQILEFRRGDPLFYVRFNTDDKVNLIRSEINDDILNLIKSQISIKKYFPGNSLKSNYDMAKSWIEFNKSKLFNKKCPFSFKK